MKPQKGSVFYIGPHNANNRTGIGFYCEVVEPPCEKPENALFFNESECFKEFIFIRPNFVDPREHVEFKKQVREISDSTANTEQWYPPEDLWTSHEEWWVSALTRSASLMYGKNKAVLTTIDSLGERVEFNEGFCECDKLPEQDMDGTTFSGECQYCRSLPDIVHDEYRQKQENIHIEIMELIREINTEQWEEHQKNNK